MLNKKIIIQNAKRFLRIRDIKTTISENKTNFSCIFKNFILKDENLISCYKIDQDDEICCGRLADFVKNDDIIVEAFLVTMFTPGELVNLIVKNNECIGNITSILNRMMADDFTIIDVCDIDGRKMNNDETINADKRGGPLICKGQFAMAIPFEECLNMFDRYLMKSNNWRDTMTDWNTGLMGESNGQIAMFERSMLSVFDKDGVLNEYLVNIVKCMRYSRLLCCTSAADYIWQVYEDHRPMEEIFFDISRQTMPQDAIENNFRVSAYLAVLDVVSQLQSDNYSGHSIDNELLAHTIIRQAVKYMMETFGMNRQFLVTLLINRMGLLAHHSDGWIEDAMKCDIMLFNVRYFGCDSTYQVSLPIPQRVSTINGLVNAIRIKTGEVSQGIYLIDMESYIKPKYDDTIDADKLNRYSCCIVESIDNMQKVQLIGRGSFGNIWEYRDRQSTFVLKKPLADDLHREIVMFARLADCANIIKCLGLVDDNGIICIGMEYKSGASLNEFLQKAALPEQTIAKISRQILTQIADMHNRGVIHGDITPGNIVLDDNGNAFLIDFGMSKIINGSRCGDFVEMANNSPPGTAWYAAPESINGEPITKKIDTWSFGVTVMEMVTGKKPYHHLSDLQVMTVVGETKLIEFYAPRGTSQDLIGFINLCKVPEPRQRATIDELIQSVFLSTYH